MYLFGPNNNILWHRLRSRSLPKKENKKSKKHHKKSSHGEKKRHHDSDSDEFEKYDYEISGEDIDHEIEENEYEQEEVEAHFNKKQNKRDYYIGNNNQADYQSGFADGYNQHHFDFEDQIPEEYYHQAHFRNAYDDEYDNYYNNHAFKRDVNLYLNPTQNQGDYYDYQDFYGNPYDDNFSKRDLSFGVLSTDYDDSDYNDDDDYNNQHNQQASKFIFQAMTNSKDQYYVPQTDYYKPAVFVPSGGVQPLQFSNAQNVQYAPNVQPIQATYVTPQVQNSYKQHDVDSVIFKYQP